MTRRYASYGSNLHPVRLQQRVPSARLLGTSYHPDYSLRFHKLSRDGSAKCGIFEGSTGVHFAVFELTENDKIALDAIEGVGKGYDLALIELPGFGECFTYLPADTHVRPDLAPYDWYREIVLLGCELHGFPDDYCAAIRDVATTKDPDDERQRINSDTVAALRRQPC